MSHFKHFTDEQLVALVKTTKEASAFNELVRRHQTSLYVFLSRFTENTFQAEDLTQDTFIKSFNRIESFNNKSQFKTWLFSIGYREFLQYKRKSQSINTMIQRFKQAFNHKKTTQIQEHIDINKSLGQLSHHQKAALILCDVCGMTHVEAAQAIDVPLGSLKTYIKQARSLMKAHLGDDNEEK